MTRVVAFFDLDRTLIDVNSAVLYAKYERRHKRISLWQMWTAVFYTSLYHLNLLDMELAYLKALRHYKGQCEKDVDKNTREFFYQEVHKRLQPGAQRALDFHRKAGHQLVLLSTSSVYQARAAAEAWGLDDVIANRFPTDKGFLNGTFEKPLCYGQGKVDLAEKWINGKGIDLEQCYFYSDSYSDLPMLQRVGNPKIVNPDPRLKQFSRRQKWEVLNWSAV
ncbi:HAD family hydrolase [Pseudobacteriovorax antillogorgiicola]|uniref:HAD-superfamily subfamily IB hydrolase, TIGR01490 n=1 Tax=Pseudobacteriovorax antillogorgiicola TaxID=1513793 RepID=A0A1Y6CFZ7_9BACT|nr:HAD family hydrolase [Pseudobacteriovorax antillogorgiicola]TCS47267.1 HAD superfamily hydrolase (TIGR01490 family) [Pseudobacteriovorax antillogorgiicola]SMF62154.1 HAD-superfamily subfamily IB hydrolase, TIGR01490 [Pseudobacteriovorax antillogorgiicola]